MKGVVSFIVVFVFVFCVLNFYLFVKSRHLKLKKLNAQLDILLMAAELKKKGIPIPEHIQRYIEELYKTKQETK